MKSPPDLRAAMRTVREACVCLYLAVDKPIADDVCIKCDALMDAIALRELALATRFRKLKNELEALATSGEKTGLATETILTLRRLALSISHDETTAQDAAKTRSTLAGNSESR